jgi:rhodanese-related sulfurtransferase
MNARILASLKRWLSTSARATLIFDVRVATDWAITSPPL